MKGPAFVFLRAVFVGLIFFGAAGCGGQPWHVVKKPYPLGFTSYECADARPPHDGKVVRVCRGGIENIFVCTSTGKRPPLPPPHTLRAAYRVFDSGCRSALRAVVKAGLLRN